MVLNFNKMFGSALIFSLIITGCASKKEVEHKNIAKCENYKNFASATFEIEGDMTEIVEKTAKKALTKSCFKKSENSNSNLRIKIETTKTLHTESGFIKDKHDNTLSLVIYAIMLIPTEQGGLTTLTSKQTAKLNYKSEPIADLGSKAEITDEEVIEFVEDNTLAALKNLFNDIP